MSGTVWPHPNDMTRDELRALVNDVSMMALDLAQNLAFANDMLREDLRADAYKHAEHEAYALGNYIYNGPSEGAVRPSDAQVHIAIAGAPTQYLGSLADLFPPDAP